MSNYKKVKKQSDNPFLNLYKLDAVDREGKVFDYYFVSRRDEEHIKLKTKDNTPEGIVVYAVTDEEKPRLLVIKEYRYPLDEYIYELPAGIIDPGEVAEQSAVREIKEETGFDLKVYKGGNEAFRRPFYMGPGFTDESNCINQTAALDQPVHVVSMTDSHACLIPFSAGGCLPRRPHPPGW